MGASSSTNSAAKGRLFVWLAAALLFVAGGLLVTDGVLAPEFGSATLKAVFAVTEVGLGLYIAVIAVGVALRFEWARLWAIWIAALASLLYVARLLIVPDFIKTRVRDFAFNSDLPHFFVLCLIAVAVSSIVVMTLTSSAGRAAFPHATDRERTDWLGLTGLTVCIALILVVMINYVVNRHYERFDVSRAAFYSLADKTVSELRSLKTPVNVIVYVSAESDLYAHLRNLISEFERFSPQLHVEYVDPLRAPARSEEVRKIYEVTEENVVVFSVELGKTRRTRVVKAEEMAEYEDVQTSPYEQPVSRLKAFKAEQAFLSALLNVLEEKQSKVYFLTGHGERDTEDYERMGYSSVTTYLKHGNLQVGQLNLATRTEIPADCDLLVVAGPRKPVPPLEIQVLRGYLARGGRMCTMLDALSDSGLTALLNEWGVGVDNDVIIGKGLMVQLGSGMLAQGDLPTAVIEQYGSHPVVAKMQDLSTQFPNARSVGVLQSSAATGTARARTRVTKLAEVTAAPAFWGEVNFEEEMGQKRLQYNEGVDLAGPLAVALAVESPLPDGSENPNGVRLVVIGSSSFLVNGIQYANNMDFFSNAVNWLLRREQLLGIAPKTPQEFALRMTPKQIAWTQFWVIIGLPGIIAFSGFVIWFVRRK